MNYLCCLGTKQKINNNITKINRKWPVVIFNIGIGPKFWCHLRFQENTQLHLRLFSNTQRHHHEFHHGAHVRRCLPANRGSPAPTGGGPGAHPLPQPVAGQRSHPHSPQQAVPDGASQRLGGQPCAASVRKSPQHGRRLLVHQQFGQGGWIRKMHRWPKSQHSATPL